MKLTRTRKPLYLKKVLTTGQIAQVFGVSAKLAGQWIDSGFLRGYRIPGSNDRRVTISEARAFAQREHLPVEGLGDPTEFVVVSVGVPKPYNGWSADLPELRWKQFDSLFSLGMYLGLRREADVLVYSSAFGYEDAARVAEQLAGVPAAVILPDDGTGAMLRWADIGFGLSVQGSFDSGGLLRWLSKAASQK